MIASRLYENLQNVRNQRREEGREEGREEIRAELASESAEWLARMQEAQRKGEPFDEAPPWEANGASES